VSVAADYKIYESLQANNFGNTPNVSPLWWRAVGHVETLYSAATSYALGATCSGANGRVYESLVAGNLGNPLPVLPETTTTKWVDVGPTNKWAMFDLASNTQTVHHQLGVDGASMTVTFAPGERINTLGLTGLVANSVTVTATSVFGGGTVYGPKTIDLNRRVVNDGYEYAFYPFSTWPATALFDLPAYSDIIVTVTLNSTSGNVKCGSCIVGTYMYLGAAQYGAENDGMNFSTITRDAYGNATLVPRRTLPRTNQTLSLPVHRVGQALAARTRLNAVPALWTGLDDAQSEYFEMLLILGVYKTFKIAAAGATMATVSLELEEI